MKAPIDPGASLRTEQFVRAQIVWSAEPGLMVPVVAVQRINGQYFVFVAEDAEGGGMAAPANYFSVTREPKDHAKRMFRLSSSRECSAATR